MNIVLIGYRGAGKSVVGNLLATRLHMPCIGVDSEIVRKAGMAIPDIVEKYGWHKFRDMESETVRELAGIDNIIVDAGGGIIERPENIEVLRVNSCIIWLKASVDKIVSRIKGSSNRPALSAGKTFTEEVTDVLERRLPMYKSAAQYEIDTNELTPEQVVDRVVEIWKKVVGATLSP